MAEVELLLELHRAATAAANWRPARALVDSLCHDGEGNKMVREAIVTN